MRILVTNDDGYSAEGLATLKAVCQSLGEVVVVAPRENNSYVGHRVNMTQPLELDQVNSSEWILSGTPADCVRVACRALQLNVDLVVSGVNHGGNLGADIYGSGTVAAAREAFFLGVPGIAFSQYRRGGSAKIEWSIVGERVGGAIKSILERKVGKSYWNVNLPCPIPFGEPVEMVDCESDLQSVEVDFSWCEHRKYLTCVSDYQRRPRESGKDIAECIDRNRITVVRLG